MRDSWNRNLKNGGPKYIIYIYIVIIEYQQRTKIHNIYVIVMMHNAKKTRKLLSALRLNYFIMAD